MLWSAQPILVTISLKPDKRGLEQHFRNLLNFEFETRDFNTQLTQRKQDSYSLKIWAFFGVYSPGISLERKYIYIYILYSISLYYIIFTMHVLLTQFYIIMIIMTSLRREKGFLNPRLVDTYVWNSLKITSHLASTIVIYKI